MFVENVCKQKSIESLRKWWQIFEASLCKRISIEIESYFKSKNALKAKLKNIEALQLHLLFKSFVSANCYIEEQVFVVV